MIPHVRLGTPRQRSYAELRELIDERLAALPLPMDVPDIARPIRASLRSGGKRVRPALLLMCHELFTSPPHSPVAERVALAVEVLHNFTLLHDDVLDDSPLRRNAPTVHERWSRDVAILSGDAMSVLALHLVAEVPAQLIRPVLDVLCHSAYQLCQGESLDLRFESRQDVGSDAYLDMVRRKTGALLGAACCLGGLVAGASDADQRRLYQFGAQLGVAFQLQDDALDLFGDQTRTGKRGGGDVLGNKMTYPILLGLEMAGAERGTLRGVLRERPENDHEGELKIAKVKRLLERCGAEPGTRAKAHATYQSALQALQQVSVPRERSGPVRALIRSLRRRTR